MNILLVNDDGVSSEGIKTLAEELRGVANIFVVAPKEQQSGVGNAMTMHRPLTYKKYLDIPDCYYVDGTPADCVKMAMHAIFKDVKFDYVISGINIGNNLGINAIYSGTISAATEASLLGKKSIAISLREPATKVKSAAKFIRRGFPAVRCLFPSTSPVIRRSQTFLGQCRSRRQIHPSHRVEEWWAS